VWVKHNENNGRNMLLLMECSAFVAKFEQKLQFARQNQHAHFFDDVLAVHQLRSVVCAAANSSASGADGCCRVGQRRKFGDVRKNKSDKRVTAMQTCAGYRRAIDVHLSACRRRTQVVKEEHQASGLLE
jgi:hypothetical protein